MNEINKKVKDLLPAGILYFLVGIGCLYILYKGIVNDPTINFLFAILGVLCGYLTTVHIVPGGSALFSMVRHKELKKADEEKFNNLIITHKNIVLIRIVSFVVLIMEAYIFISNSSQSTILNVNDIAWLVFWNFLTVGLLTTGVKYISAWWNVKNKSK